MADLTKPTSAGAASSSTGASVANTNFESWSNDVAKAAGLQDISVAVDAGATIGANSTLKSVASAQNVTGDSGSLAEVAYNSGLQHGAGVDNTIGVKADAGLSGIATTNIAASSSTSNGQSNAFSTLADAAGIQDLASLTVGGAATVVGKAVTSMSATADNVAGNASAASELSNNATLASDTAKIEGFQGGAIGVSSDASLQGLAQLSNTATAGTSTGAADAEAFANQLQGVDLTGMKVGGTANLVGQASLSNLSSAEAVTGASEATSQMGLGAQGLVASGTTFTGSTVAGLDIASDAGLTGLASITNNATAKTSAGLVDADAIGTSIQGANLNTVQIGGVGTIGGQATYGAKATAENVNGGYSDALADLTSVDGLVAGAKLNIASDATIQGLASITNDAMASSTGATGTTASDPSGSATAIGSRAIAEANTLKGADLFSDTDIGGIGSITGQVNFGSKATAENVTGAAWSSASLGEQTAAGAYTGGLAQGLVSGVAGTTSDSNFGTDIKSDATIKGLSSLNLQAAANTTAGVADADAFAGTIDGASLGDVQIGGIGSLAGQSSFTGKAASSNVTGGASTADAKLVDADGMSALAGLKISANGGITGLNNANLSAIAESTGASSATTSATATASAQFLQGAELGAAGVTTSIGGIGNVVGQTNFTSLADASNVSGSASATGNLGQSSGFAEGLDLAGTLSVSSDATIKGITGINSTAKAETTSGAASATAWSDLINGADLSAGVVNVGGLASIQGQANFNFTANASNVDGGAASATADSDIASGLIAKGTYAGTGVSNDWTATDIAGLGIASDATITGMAIGSEKATASSTAYSAAATAGAGDAATGAQLPSLNVGGLANITAAAQLDSAATATNVGTSSLGATALAGQGQTVTGLNSTGEAADAAWVANTAASSGTPSLSSHSFETWGANGTGATALDLNINVASDATLNAKGFSNLDAIASSTAGAAIADAGSSSSTVTGIAAGMDINIGGVGNLTALAQGTADASAESVTGLADAFGAQSALGISQLEMKTASDDTLKSTASVVGSATAATTGDATGTDFAAAGLDFDATGIKGLAMQAGGLGNLTATGSVTGNADATSVAGPADARGEIDAMGLEDAWFSSASDGNITGMGIINSGVHATSTASTANAEGDFDATGIKSLEAGIGGISTLKGQAQVKAAMSAESVSGSVNAYSGTNLADSTLSGAFHMTGDGSSITGLNGIELKGASDGNILGTASGTFDTHASTTLGDATVNAAQTLRGINTLNLDLGGQGAINAIVNDHNFADAHSVSGNATAIATVDAIGLNGGNIHIAGNATILANVGVDSEAKAHTIS